MNLSLDMPAAALRDWTGEVRRALAHELTAAARRTGAALRDELRAATLAAALGRLAMTWQRPRVYPEGRESLSPAVFVASKAPLPMRAFAEGVVIRSKTGGWLAIPTPEVAKMRGFAAVAPKEGGGLVGVGPRRARITPAGFVAATGLHLRLVYVRPGLGLLVTEGIASRRARLGLRRRSARETARGRVANLSMVAFILVPQATIRKRVDAAGIAERAAARLRGELATAIERASVTVARGNGSSTGRGQSKT